MNARNSCAQLEKPRSLAHAGSAFSFHAREERAFLERPHHQHRRTGVGGSGQQARFGRAHVQRIRQLYEVELPHAVHHREPLGDRSRVDPNVSERNAQVRATRRGMSKPGRQSKSGAASKPPTKPQRHGADRVGPPARTVWRLWSYLKVAFALIIIGYAFVLFGRTRVGNELLIRMGWRDLPSTLQPQ
jgi:hypothetical protein